MQGRWDLIVYVLSCYYVVHGVCTPFAFLCASDAVSKVELIVAHAKLGLIADCFFLFSGGPETGPANGWWLTKATDFGACTRLAHMYRSKQASKGTYSHRYACRVLRYGFVFVYINI
jgi:hypothetical protein